jgi:DNA-binding NtrC family response regulator
MQKCSNEILIIDDDEDLAESLKRMLLIEGFSVDTAASGSEALDKISKKDYDVALIDIVLPDMNGTALLPKFKRKLFGNTRKIIITGFSTVENAIESINCEANAFVRKPIDSFALLKIIRAQFLKRDEEIKMVQNKVSEIVNKSISQKIAELEMLKSPESGKSSEYID